VACTLTTSPGLTLTFQPLSEVAVMETSHDTAPAGSQYLATEWKTVLVTPSRVTLRSVYRPPGCRWPAVPTSVDGLVTVHSLA